MRPYPFIPAEAFPPGEYMRDEADYRGWPPEEVARRMDVDVSLVLALYSAEAPLTMRLAFKAWRAFGVQPETWMACEEVYRWWLTRKQLHAGGAA